MTPKAGIVDPADAAAAPFTARMFFALFPSIMLPMFLAAIEGSIVSTALPAMAGALGDVERVPWVVVSYLLAATIAAPIYGRLADVLGRRRMLLVCLGINLLTSILCGLAWSLPVLTAFRSTESPPTGAGALSLLPTSTLWMRLLPVSRIKTVPSGAKVMPSGWRYWPIPEPRLPNLPRMVPSGLCSITFPFLASRT